MKKKKLLYIYIFGAKEKIDKVEDFGKDPHNPVYVVAFYTDDIKELRADTKSYNAVWEDSIGKIIDRLYPEIRKSLIKEFQEKIYGQKTKNNYKKRTINGTKRNNAKSRKDIR